jgi:hypothetical protein
MNELMDAIRAVLTPDLLKPQYRNHPENPMYGHCSVASEALYHLCGGLTSGLQPYHGKDDTGTVHWWLGRVLINAPHPLSAISAEADIDRTLPHVA